MSISHRDFLKMLSAGAVLSLSNFSIFAQNENEARLLNNILCPILMYHYMGRVRIRNSTTTQSLEWLVNRRA